MHQVQISMNNGRHVISHLYTATIKSIFRFCRQLRFAKKSHINVARPARYALRMAAIDFHIRRLLVKISPRSASAAAVLSRRRRFRVPRRSTGGKVRRHALVSEQSHWD